MIPGLENAEFLRFGQIHRNTYLQSPRVLLPTLQTKRRQNLLIGGQICGVEGYVESIATGLIAGINAGRIALNLPPMAPPRLSACGSLVHYIASTSPADFQPANISFGLLPAAPQELKRKDRKEHHRLQVQEALRAMDRWIVSLEEEAAVRSAEPR